MIQSSARPLQNLRPEQQFDPNLDTIPCDLSPLAKAWTEPDPLDSPQASSAAPAPLRRAEQGVQNGTGKGSTTTRSDKAEVEVISLSDTPESPEKTSQEPAPPEGHATLPQQVEVKKTPPSGDRLEDTPVSEGTSAPNVPAAVEEAKGTSDSQLPQCSKEGNDHDGKERKSLFLSEEVVTRKQQFEERDRMKKGDGQNGSEEEGEEEKEEGKGKGKGKPGRKKMSPRAKAQAKKANEAARKEAAKQKALAKKEAKKAKALAKKAEKKAKALAIKEEKKRKAQQAKRGKKAAAEAKKAAEKYQDTTAKKKKKKEVEEEKEKDSTPQGEPDIGGGSDEAEMKQTSKRKARTVGDAKAKKRAKAAKQGDVTQAEEPEPAPAGQSAPSRPKVKATFARRARPKNAVSGLRWDALKQVFNEKLSHQFLRPSQLEEK